MGEPQTPVTARRLLVREIGASSFMRLTPSQAPNISTHAISTCHHLHHSSRGTFLCSAQSPPSPFGPPTLWYRPLDSLANADDARFGSLS